MPHTAQEAHRRRHERVVFGELQLRGEDAAFIWCALGAKDHGFPDEEVVLVDGAGGDAIRRVGGEVFVLLEEALGGDGVHFRERYQDCLQTRRLCVWLGEGSAVGKKGEVVCPSVLMR